MAAAEIENLNGLRSLLADLPEWSTWTGLATTPERLARILSLEDDGTEFPLIAIDFGAGSRTNAYGSDSSANFRPGGSLVVAVFDRDIESAGTVTERYLEFAGRFFQIIEELIEGAHDSLIMIDQIVYSDQPIIRGAANVHHSQDTDDDGVDDSTESPHWIGTFQIPWGGAPNQ